MTHLTATIIQSRGDDIHCEILGQDKDTDKYAGAIMLYNGDEPHCMLLSTQPIFSTEEDCLSKLRHVVDEIRKLDLTKAGGGIPANG